MRISRVIVILLLLASFIHLNMACGENDYVSMSDIQKNTPSHWINTYNTADGRAVSINIPILLPDVEKVPIYYVLAGEALMKSLMIAHWLKKMKKTI